MPDLDRPYTERAFWTKVRSAASKAGREVIEKALVLYYATRDPRTPAWARTTIYGALAYFLVPTDAVADFLPGVGYTDDLGVLLTAFATVAVHVRPQARRKAREQADQLFGARHEAAAS